ncbi:S-adenosyl-L-methionine-dependent methyltransferase [Aspergillus karnatakaensis]|uniref:S-adenosyl-L-methionine-dependent methyltransferase n=1 Tax=Aspergillus karnatakaensis TaxID=1810916 RepID=UPI003CCE2E52
MTVNGINSTNGTNGSHPVNHANGPKADLVDGLLHNVTETIGAFKAQRNEKDRLAALKAAQELVRALHEPKDNVYHLVYSPTQAMCVRMGIDLEIFTTLSQSTEPRSVEELAAVKNASPLIAERVLRVLAGIGYVEEHDVHLYTATRMTHQMADRYSVAMVKFIYDFGMSSVARVPEFLRKHDYQFVEGPTSGPWQYGTQNSEIIWEWIAKSPERIDITNSFMEADRGSRPPWVVWFPVEERVINPIAVEDDEVFLVDVAGGRGHDIRTFREKLPHVKGRFILEDLQHVVEQSVEGLDAEKIVFDLFKEQPLKGARIYYMKFILHDWSDKQCLQILGHIRDAMKAGYSKLIIEEFILPEKDCPMLSAMWDWEMMVFCNSLERSESHWTRLLSDAGFEARFWYPPGDGQGIIEAELKSE